MARKPDPPDPVARVRTLLEQLNLTTAARRLADLLVQAETTQPAYSAFLQQILEAQASLQRMLVTIPLTDDERAAVDEGADAVERLLTRLADTPTPAGPTPREIPPPSGPLLSIKPLRPEGG